jgi:Na+/H+ antiporter NhaD/arsenite permease-like protein
MLLGEIPGLALDRTGVALLGALALVATERVTPAAAWAAVDVPTLALLFGLMVVSAQFRLGGFYTWATRRIVAAPLGPSALLGAVVVVSGALSAVLANDIVCLAVAPLLAEGCARRGLAPVPFLLALACAANVGSAATLIGNPQNMLIGQTLRLSFAGFLADALVPAALGLALVWGLIHDMRWLFPATAVLSNLVSNVPAVMLLLPHASHPLAGPILALSSTLAGNLLIVGSIANIIVVDQAAALGVRIGWREHARVGVPVTLATLAVAAAWLAFRGMSS